MQIFNQMDYPKDYLGKTQYTVARWGCLTTCVVMIHDYIFDKALNPAQAGQILAYLSTGDLIWSSIGKLGLKLDARVRTYRKDLIDKAFADPDKYIAIQVNGFHWVWVIGRYIPYLGYRIVDPLGGTKCWSSKYRSITGHALISKL